MSNDKYFDTAKATIKEISLPILDEVIETLEAHPEIKKVRIEGHTDSMGAHAYNVDLSYRRAAAVKDYLTNGGVASDRLESKGYGPDNPIDTNDTREGRAKNRRVDFVIVNQ